MPDGSRATLTVRAWRAGDRMRPLGLGGTKSLQDLFTDRKVPRGLRRTLPVVESDGEIAWVAGVAAVGAVCTDCRLCRCRAPARHLPPDNDLPRRRYDCSGMESGLELGPDVARRTRYRRPPTSFSVA